MSQRTLAKRGAAPAPAPKKQQSRVRYWVKEILTTGAVLVIVALALAGGISQDTMGLIVGCVAVGGAVYMTAVPVAEESNSPKVKAGIYAFCVVWALAAMGAFYPLVKPGAPLAKAELPEEGAEKSVGKLAPGRYQVVESVPRNAVAGETSYVVSVKWSGGEERVSGRFVKSDFRTRAGRKGRGAAHSIHSTNRDEMRIGGGETKVRLENVEGGLGGAMTVSFYRRRIPYWAWFALELLVLAGASVLDALFSDRKRRAVITIGAFFTLVFVELARESVSPSNVHRPLIGAAIGGLVAAALGGYILNIIARAVAAKVRRKSATA